MSMPAIPAKVSNSCLCYQFLSLLPIPVFVANSCLCCQFLSTLPILVYASNSCLRFQFLSTLLTLCSASSPCQRYQIRWRRIVRVLRNSWEWYDSVKQTVPCVGEREITVPTVCLSIRAHHYLQSKSSALGWFFPVLFTLISIDIVISSSCSNV